VALVNSSPEIAGGTTLSVRRLMPLIFAENESTESGITYADRTGVVYQFPRMYSQIIREGERFIYYRGRRRHDGSRAPQVYFGRGIVGRIWEDEGAEDRFLCEILDFEPFPSPVPFKDAGGVYLETGGARRGYFQRGVRMISEDDFRRILTAAEVEVEATAVDEEERLGGEALSRHPRYASTADGKLVEEFAVRWAIEEIRRRYPEASIELQPRNNPGFDVLVRTGPGDSTLFVEVKGSRGGPRFFLTEGERQFAVTNGGRYRLIVVHEICLASGRCKTYWHEGAVSIETGFQLKAVQWACEVPS